MVSGFGTNPDFIPDLYQLSSRTLLAINLGLSRCKSEQGVGCSQKTCRAQSTASRPAPAERA